MTTMRDMYRPSTPTIKKWGVRAVSLWAAAYTALSFTVGLQAYIAAFDHVGARLTWVTEEWANAHLLLILAAAVGSPVLISVALAVGTVLLRNALVNTAVYTLVAAHVSGLASIIFTLENLRGLLSLAAFVLSIGAVNALLGLSKLGATKEEAMNDLALGLLIPIDPLLLAWAVPGIILGAICRKMQFELSGLAKAGLITCIIAIVLSFTKVGAVIPFMLHEIASFSGTL